MYVYKVVKIVQRSPMYPLPSLLQWLLLYCYNTVSKLGILCWNTVCAVSCHFITCLNFCNHHKIFFMLSFYYCTLPSLPISKYLTPGNHYSITHYINGTMNLWNMGLKSLAIILNLSVSFLYSISFVSHILFLIHGTTWMNLKGIMLNE